MTPPDKSGLDPSRQGAPKSALWAIGVGIVLMLGGFVMVPLLPGAPPGIQMAGVIVGVLIFGLGLFVLRVWIMTEAQRDNDERRKPPR
jgi:uncharacterized membrane protein YhdT